MARSATIHRATLELSLVDRGVYASPTITVARHPSETLERMIVRLLAFGLAYEEGLEFGRGLSTRDEPDLWRRAADGALLHWIDVGQPEARRLQKASRRSERVTVLAFGSGAERWRASQGGEWPSIASLGVAWIGPEAVAWLAAETDRQIRWSLTTSGGTLYVAAGTRSLETSLEVWFGAPLD
jgi:uncharacterized protein YaeQ